MTEPQKAIAGRCACAVSPGGPSPQGRERAALQAAAHAVVVHVPELLDFTQRFITVSVVFKKKRKLSKLQS